MRFFDEWFSEMNHVTKKAFAFTLAAILVFSIGFAAGTYSNINASIKSDALNTTAAPNGGASTNTGLSPVNPTEAPATTEAPAATEAPATTDAPAVTDEPDSTQAAAPTEKPADTTGAPKTTAEILAYYNESANKIKTNATSVTRNWEDLHSDDEYLEVPSALQSIGKTLMNTFLKKDETPLTWSTKEEIIANYPVKGQDYVSKATEADVSSATCVDDGTYYNITINFKECTDPSGSGCDNAFNVIKTEEVMNAAKVVQQFSCKYYDAKIECKVEKATGNMVAATYTLPIIMQVTAKVVVSLDAQVGMTFIDDYSIAY